MVNISSDAQKVLKGADANAMAWITSQDFGGKLTSGEAKRFLDSWNTQQAKILAALAKKEKGLPDELKNNPSYKNLSPDMKEIVIYNYQIQKANDKQKAENLAIALEEATDQADPYWKNIILIAQDEVLSTFEAIEGDHDSSINRQMRIIDNINEDLQYNKEFLSLEEQSSLSRIAQDYEVKHENILETAAGAGLTFSTKRKLAERRLAKQNENIVESTQRQYGKQQRDIDVESERAITEAEARKADIDRKTGEAYQSAGRAAEKYLGTENLPDQLKARGIGGETVSALDGSGSVTTPGGSFGKYDPLGSVPGQLYEEKVKDIEARKNTIFDELNAESLNFNVKNYL